MHTLTHTDTLDKRKLLLSFGQRREIRREGETKRANDVAKHEME